MVFCRIPAGRFRMGQRGEVEDEEPEHWVEIPEGFWLGETPVTQEQYGVWKPEHEHGFPGRPKHPAENMTWRDAVGFCEWLTEVCREEIPEGMVARLPLEAEWEYGCRAGTRTEYYSGDGEEALARAGWYHANAGGETHAVGEKEANGWGLRDLHGNVWEWCEDKWDDDVYKRREDGAVVGRVWGVEGEGESRDDQHRVLRGGSWLISARFCRAAIRLRFLPGYRRRFVGFRVCLVPGPAVFEAGQKAAGDRRRS
jgi:formylglycine-generating enzyme required for sulfatase activity